MTNNVTIIIPTYNRHRQLKRLLEYYSSSHLPILVADSTSTPFPEAKYYRNVKYFHYPNYPYAKKLPLIYKKVKTKYVLFCADDDFVIPASIKDCVNFLEKNPSYNSAHGHYIFFENRSNQGIIAYPFYLESISLDVNSDLPSKRMVQLLSAYMQLLYAVTKTSDIKQVFRYLEEYPDIKNDNMVEIFQAIILCISGKSKTLPILYCTREVTPNSARTFTDDLDAVYTQKKYAKEYQAWLEAISKHLAKKERITRTEAKLKVQAAVDLYLKHTFMYVPFLKISILNVQRMLNKYSFGLAKKIYNLVLPSPESKNIKKHAFSKRSNKKEFEKIRFYIRKYDNYDIILT